MKIILKEKQIKKLIKEDMGVSRICITYSNIILNKLTPLIEKQIKERESGRTKLIIPLKELSDAWQTNIDEYVDFPISEIRIDFYTHVKSPGQLNGTYATGGGAEQIEPKSSKYSYLTSPPKELPKYVKEQIDSTLVAKFDFELYMTKDFDESEKNELIFDLRDTILHETNHMLEFFKRAETGAGYVNVALGLSGGKNYNVPRDIFDIWQEFTTMVYYSEPQEMRAMTQEMYSVRERVPFETFKQHRYYIASKIMQEFNADTMFDTMVERIETYNPDYLVSILTSLWKWFMEDYYATLKVLKLQPNPKIQNSVHVLQLMKILQPRINNAGKKLQRNFNRLYSIETN